MMKNGWYFEVDGLKPAMLKKRFNVPPRLHTLQVLHGSLSILFFFLLFAFYGKEARKHRLDVVASAGV